MLKFEDLLIIIKLHRNWPQDLNLQICTIADKHTVPWLTQPPGLRLSTTLLLAPPDIETFLQPCLINWCRISRTLTASTVNPILTWGWGRLYPPHYYLPPNFQTFLRPCLVNWCRISRTLAASAALLKDPWKKLLDKTLAILFCGILLVSSFRRDFFLAKTFQARIQVLNNFCCLFARFFQKITDKRQT